MSEIDDIFAEARAQASNELSDDERFITEQLNAARRVDVMVLDAKATLERAKAAYSELVDEAQAHRDAVKEFMLAQGEVKNRLVTLIRNPAKVCLKDEVVVPDEYLRTKTITEPDKKAIKAALENGDALEFAYLSQDYRVKENV